MYTCIIMYKYEIIHVQVFVYRNHEIHAISAYSCEPSGCVRIKSYGIFPLRTYNTRTMQVRMNYIIPGITKTA